MAWSGRTNILGEEIGFLPACEIRFVSKFKCGRALLTTVRHVYNKLDFEISRALAILASFWPLQGDFVISPEQFFVCLDCFLCDCFQIWFGLVLKLSGLGRDLGSDIDRNLSEAY